MSKRDGTTDEILVRGLFREHGAALVAYALRLTGDRPRAEAAVREALTRACRTPPDPAAGPGSVRATLFAGLRSVTTDLSGGRPVTADHATVPTDLDTAAIGVQAPVDPITEIDAMKALGSLDRLEPERRRVLDAVYFQGLDVAEAARALGLSEATVKADTTLALRHLGGSATRSGSHDNELLGPYILGVLDRHEWTAADRHLRLCERCRLEADDLRRAEATLAAIPPEALLAGPPPDADPLLHNTLLQVRGQHRARQRKRRSRRAVAATAILLGALAAGTLTGRLTVGPSTASAAPAAAARTGSAADRGTGASMAVVVQPAAGWVRLHATVGGIAAGEQCRLYVVAHDGSRQQAGSWLVSEAAAATGTSLDGSALIAPSDVAAVQAETYAGRLLVSVPL